MRHSPDSFLMPPKQCWLERPGYFYWTSTNMKNNSMYKSVAQNSKFKNYFQFMSVNLNRLVPIRCQTVIVIGRTLRGI